MNKKSLLIFAVLVSWRSFAQTFPASSAGIISYEEIIELDSMKSGMLFSSGLKWLTSLEEEKVTIATKDSLNGHITGSSSFLVYSQTGLLKKISGRFSYTFSIDVKDNKYRYRFTDFVFHHYQQNRNYQMVETIKTKKMEEVTASGWQKLWDKHRTAVGQRIAGHIHSLQQKMKEREAVEKKIVKKQVEW